MIQNSQIVPLVKRFSQLVAVVVISAGWTTGASAQIVNSDAFNETVGSAAAGNAPVGNLTADHSILEVADEAMPAQSPTENENGAARLSPVTLTKIDQDDANYDAPAAPAPRLTGVKSQAVNGGTLGGNTSGTFAHSTSNNPSNTSTNRAVAQRHSSQLQPAQPAQSIPPTRSVNRLRGTDGLPSAQQDRAENPTQRQIQSSVSGGSFGNQRSTTSQQSSGFASSSTVVTGGTNSTASVYRQTTGPDQGTDQIADQTEQPKYESAYLHDQSPRRGTPAADTFSHTSNMQKRAAPAQRSQSLAKDDFAAKESKYVQKTAYLSPVTPAAPADPQFQTGGYRQSFNQNKNQQSNPQLGQNGHRGQRGSAQRGQHGQRDQTNQQASQNQQTRHRNLPGHNQSHNQSHSQSQNQQQDQPSAADSNAAKQAIAKFAFDANQQSANGLPIRMRDFLQQSQGRASRNQLIPQYWEVYYDWAQSISASHHLDWVSSIKSAQQNDASSIEIAKSNAQNEITFTAIQLGKSQAKMKSLTGNAQPIVPMDNPTVTRVKTNYDAFKSRGLISPKFEGIDSSLRQMYDLIQSRANTVAMAQENAKEAQQLYSRNQSTVDHVLTAGRTWRTAESDFIASVIEYNKAYADYALALPYGRGPLDTVVNMLIVKPSSNQNAGSQTADGRPNLANDTGSNSVSQNSAQNNARGNDYSIPYSNNQPNDRSAASRSSRQISQTNAAGFNGGNMRRASNSAGLSPRRPSNTGTASPASATSNLTQNALGQSAPRQTAQPATSAPSSTSATSAGTNYIRRPSQFPGTQPAAAASPFSPATGQRQPASQPAQKAFQTRPSTPSPVGDRTAGRPSPFAPAATSGAATAPAAKPKPPASTSGFSFGG